MATKRDRAAKVLDSLSSAVNAGKLELSSQKFQELCDALGWGASEFSEKLGISGQSFYRWKKGTKLPRKSNLEKIRQFLTKGDLDWTGPPVNPFDLGIQTWKHMAERANKKGLEETWIFSVEEFLEGRVREANKRMLEVIQHQKKAFFYVYPAHSSAAISWDRWIEALNIDMDKKPPGNVVGFQILETSIEQFPMFTRGLYSVLYNHADGTHEGFFAFRVALDTLKLLGQEEAEGKQPDMIWIRVDDETAGWWYDSYCADLKDALRKSGKIGPVISLDYRRQSKR